MKFWRTIAQRNEQDIEFRVNFYKWLWSQSKIKQAIIEQYIIGANQIEIAAGLKISPIKVRCALIDAEKSLERNIKNYKAKEN